MGGWGGEVVVGVGWGWGVPAPQPRGCGHPGPPLSGDALRGTAAPCGQICLGLLAPLLSRLPPVGPELRQAPWCERFPSHCPRCSADTSEPLPAVQTPVGDGRRVGQAGIVGGWVIGRTEAGGKEVGKEKEGEGGALALPRGAGEGPRRRIATTGVEVVEDVLALTRGGIRDRVRWQGAVGLLRCVCDSIHQTIVLLGHRCPQCRAPLRDTVSSVFSLTINESQQGTQQVTRNEQEQFNDPCGQAF